jgi:hypothetical protein
MFRAAGIDLFAQLIDQPAQAGEVHAVVGEFEVGQRGGCSRAVLQRIPQPAGAQALLDRDQTAGVFRVTGAHFMERAGRGCVVAGFRHHGASAHAFAAKLGSCKKHKTL